MNKPTILVTGGAGYIGSHAVLALHDAGWPVVVADNLSNGRREAIPEGVPLVEVDVGDADAMADAVRRPPDYGDHALRRLDRGARQRQ